MVGEKEKSQRRVYVLPTDLVDRIVAYQQEMGISSEVEAARRLLDEALKRRDDWRQLTRRFLERLEHTRVLTDIAGDVLIGHPLVSGMNFGQDEITFVLTTGERVTIRKDASYVAHDEDGDSIHLEPQTSGFSRDMDDEIPF